MKIKNIIWILLIFTFSCNDDHNKTTIFHSVDSWHSFRGNMQLTGECEAKLSSNLQLLWTYETGDDIKSSAVIGYGNVYIGSNDGFVHAIDLESGQKKWTFNTGDDVEAPPMLLDEHLYIGSLSGSFYKLDAISGDSIWHYEADDEIYGSATWIPAPAGGGIHILLGSYDSRLHCLDAKTGEMLWQYETDNYINGTPASDGKRVMFGGCDEQLHVVSAIDGLSLGNIDVGSYIPSSPALADDFAYVAHFGGKLLAINYIKQETVWEFTNDGADPFFASPAVNDDVVILGARDKKLYCVDRKDGHLIWSFQTLDDVDGSAVLSSDKVVFGSLDGILYILSLETGKKLWSYEIGARIYGSPAVISGRVVIGAEDGRVYAFGGK